MDLPGPGTSNPYAAPVAAAVAPPPCPPSDRHQPRFFATTGRIGRVRLAAYLLITAGAGVAASLPAGLFGKLNGLTFVPSLIGMCFMVILSIVHGRRRMHDLGLSSWFLLASLVPVLNVAVFVALYLLPGQPTANAWGAPPAPDRWPIKVAGWVGIAAGLVGSGYSLAQRFPQWFA